MAASFSLAVIGLHARAATICKLEKYAALPVTMAGTRPLVAGTVNGQQARFLAGSGAFFSVLTRDGAEKFKLHVRSLSWNLDVRGGGADSRLTSANDLTLAGIGSRTSHRVDFIVGGNAMGPGIDGIIGQNIFARA